MILHRVALQLYIVLCACFIFRSTDAQCTQNFAPFTSLCSGQGTCENNTRCICDANYNGVTLIFDVGDTDCPIHRLAFSALGYIQFGVSILALIATAFRLITFRNEDFKSKKMRRTWHILVSMIVSASLCAVYAALYSFGGLFIYNSIASLVFYSAFWLGLGADLYFRKVNIYKLFVATSIGEDKKKLRNSKKIFGLEVFTCVFLPATQIAFGIAVYVVNDLQIRIGLTQGSAASLLGSFIINGAVPLSYAIQVRNRLSEHLKTDAAADNAKTIRVGLKKIKMIIVVLLSVIIVPLIPNVLVIAMPVVHAYIFQIFLILYQVTIMQASILILQPSKIRNVRSTSTSTPDTPKQQL